LIGEEDEDEEVYKTANLKMSQEQRRESSKLKRTLVAEWALFVCIVGVLIASLTASWFQGKMIWGLLFQAMRHLFFCFNLCFHRLL